MRLVLPVSVLSAFVVACAPTIVVEQASHAATSGTGQVVLQLVGAQHQQVALGEFYAPNTVLGDCWYEAVVKPTPAASGGYIYSDGWGGSHAMLFGLEQWAAGSTADLKITGNIWNGSSIQSFGSFDGVYDGEWSNLAVTVDTTNHRIHTYVKGVPAGSSSFTGSRQSSAGIGVGEGPLYVGGSNHSSYDGEVAWARAWEAGAVPVGLIGAPYRAYVPEIYPQAQGYDPGSSTWTQATLLLDFSTPERVVPDIGAGWNNGAGAVVYKHDGIINNANGGDPYGAYGGSGAPASPLPEFVVDATFDAPQTAGIDAPTSAPTGAWLWDSFSRADQTLFDVQYPSLGSTEAGSVVATAWTVYYAPGTAGSPSVGILNNRVVPLRFSAGMIAAAVDPRVSSDMRVKVRRNVNHAGLADEGACNTYGATTGICSNVGLVWRYVDAQNFCVTYTYVAAGSGPATRTDCYVGGVSQSGFADKNTPSTGWYDLYVDAVGTDVTIGTCTASGTCSVIFTYPSVTYNAVGTGGGLAFPPGADGRERADNFCMSAPGGC